nr:heat shock cognate 70 kDa protein 2-like [Tanacetum cinerariifolium]GEZ66250.1 heat shock cognate 70 kDa protein 2-like [Tanacetum cinerariifolium]
NKEFVPPIVGVDEAVAVGAGILAANLSGQGNKAVRSLEIIDVTPLPLGLKCKGNVMVVLIMRNSPIPTKKEAPWEDVKISVCYEIDVNGILHISARELTTGTHNTIKITNTSSLLEVEIEKMIEDAKQYKQDDEEHMKKTKARNALKT